MPQLHQIPFKPTNQIWRTYKHFPYKAWYAVGELVDNSTQSYFDNRAALDEVFAREGSGLLVAVTYSPVARELVVHDNAMGMDLEQLKHAVQLAHPPADTSGRCEFGMGLKTASSWLGTKWAVRTKKYGVPHEYSFEIDIAAHASSQSEQLVVVEKNVDDVAAHYTEVRIEGVRGEIQGGAIGRIKQHLAEMYRKDIEAGVLTLQWNTDPLRPPAVSVLETTIEERDGDVVRVETRRWSKDVEFEVTLDPATNETATVTGWICLVSPGGRNKAGFDLLRRGRVIIGRPVGYRPERIFGLARNDLINQRLYGELNMDAFPVNHLKDDFLWDSWGQEFEEKLEAISTDYVRKARETGGSRPIPPAVVQSTNDDLADALSTEDLAASIDLLENVGPTPAPPAEITRAEAEILRNQAIEPRVVDHMGRSYRIYHPQGMSPDQLYVRYEGPSSSQIDIFINDNHPHLAGLGEGPGAAERYQIHTLNCVVDAIACHLLDGLARPVTTIEFSQYKDRLMRVLTAQRVFS